MIAILIISPSLENRIEKINQILSEEKIPTNHPDTLYFPNDTKLGIEQVKKVREHFILKPYQLKGKVVILEDASKLTVEAQNALLKTLEEPPEEAVLILGAPSEDKLLPTILSRCQIVYLQTPHNPALPAGRPSPITHYDDLEKLLALSTEERFEYIANLKEKEEFLQAMISIFREKLINEQGQKYHDRDKNVPDTDLKPFLHELLKAEEWEAQNVNIRAILEYLMLVMPKLTRNL